MGERHQKLLKEECWLTSSHLQRPVLSYKSTKSAKLGPMRKKKYRSGLFTREAERGEKAEYKVQQVMWSWLFEESLLS